MPEKELPADWMIKRAIEVMRSRFELEEVKQCPFMYMQTINVAHYIGEHETAPVDPDLLLAREASAQVNERMGYTNTALDNRNGENDGHLEIRIALRAIELARERGAL